MIVQTLSYTRARGWSSPLPMQLDGPQTLVLSFGASDLLDDEQPLRDLRHAFAQAIHTGCSTAGEIFGTCVEDDSISVAVVQFAHTHLIAASAPLVQAQDSYAAGEQIAAGLAKDGLRAVLVLSEGLNANGTTLVQGLVEHLPHGVRVMGGLAGDGTEFVRTWVFDGDRACSGTVRAVGLYGPHLSLGLGCNGGWSDFGPERRITRSEGNVLFELDNKPALDLYKQYLGELAAGLPSSALLFPLSIRRQGGANHLVRTVLSIDEETKSLTFAGDVPQGAIARLMRTTNEALIQSAMQAGEQANRAHLPPQSTLLLSISCVGRRLLLGERSEEEVEAVTQSIGHAVPHIGFYSYGEISPGGVDGTSELHNQTMTVTAISEVDVPA